MNDLKNNTRAQEIIKRFCALSTLVRNEIFHNEHACDCFCHERSTGLDFQFDEIVIKRIEDYIINRVAEETDKTEGTIINIYNSL